MREEVDYARIKAVLKHYCIFKALSLCLIIKSEFIKIILVILTITLDKKQQKSFDRVDYIQEFCRTLIASQINTVVWMSCKLPNMVQDVQQEL